MGIDATYRSKIDSGLVAGFVEATGDENPIHRNSNLAIRIYSRIQGAVPLDEALKDGGKSHLIVPGALLVQQVGPLLKRIRPDLTRVEQDFTFKGVLLTSTTGRPLETRVCKLEESEGVVTYSTLVYSGERQLVCGRASLIDPSSTDIRLRKEIDQAEHVREKELSLAYQEILRLEEAGVHLEYWLTEILGSLFSLGLVQIDPKGNTMVYREQTLKVNPSIHLGVGSRFKLEFKETEPKEIRRVGILRPIKVQGSVGDDIFLVGKTTGLELRVA